jgi:hypothetical protein
MKRKITKKETSPIIFFLHIFHPEHLPQTAGASVGRLDVTRIVLLNGWVSDIYCIKIIPNDVAAVFLA